MKKKDGKKGRKNPCIDGGYSNITSLSSKNKGKGKEKAVNHKLYKIKRCFPVRESCRP
jgi:hypothetical protein